VVVDRFGVNAPEFPGVAQAVMLDNDAMVAPAVLWGKLAFYHGPLTGEVKGQRVDGLCDLKKDRVGCAVYRSKGALTLLAINAAGEGQAFAIGPDGSYRRDLGSVTLKPATPAKAWTTLAMKHPDTLLGAADGQVIEMARDGADWRERGRWRADFGPAIRIAADSGELWVADRDRHRVAVLGLATEKPLAGFGTPDRPGAGLRLEPAERRVGCGRGRLAGVKRVLRQPAGQGGLAPGRLSRRVGFQRSGQAALRRV